MSNKCVFNKGKKGNRICKAFSNGVRRESEIIEEKKRKKIQLAKEIISERKETLSRAKKLGKKTIEE